MHQMYYIEMIVCVLLKIPTFFSLLYTKTERIRQILAWEREKRKIQIEKKRNRRKERNVWIKMSLQCLHEIHENYVYFPLFIVAHSYHLKIFNTWEYSCITWILPHSLWLLFRPDPNPNVCCLYMHFIYILCGKFTEFFLFICILYVCVFQYKIFTRRENQAERTLNGCYRVVVLCVLCICNCTMQTKWIYLC